MRSWFIGLTVAVALTPVARAADAPKAAPPKGPAVVVVGVGETADDTIKPRASAEADAKALFKLLTDMNHLDVADGRAKLLVGKEATREAIVKALATAVESSGKGDPVIFAFFGRAASAGEATCLFAADTKFKERNKTGVLGTDLQAALKGAKDQKVAVFLDVDFKGYDAGKEAVIEPNLTDLVKALDGGEDREDPPHDKLLVLSNAPDGEALAAGESSLFAKTVRDALAGTADAEGYEADGLVTVDELVKFVNKTMIDEARKQNKLPKDREAVSLAIGAGVSHFVLTKNPKVTDSVAKRVKALDELEANGKIGKDVLAEGKGLVSRMPKLKQPQELRKKFQALADGTLTADDFAKERKTIKDALVLPADIAAEFARNVQEAAGIVEENYVRKVTNADLTEAAIRGLYQRLDEPLPAEVDTNLKGARKWTREEAKAALADARTRLGKREDLDDDKDATFAIGMMLRTLNDPHTVYWDRETLKKLESQFRGEFRGVGIQIRRDLARDGILVVSPIKGSPAYKAGIQAGDLIVGIKRDSDPNGDPLKPGDQTEFSTKGMKTDDAIKIILGKPGVPITLAVERDGKVTDYPLARARVRVESVFGVTRDEKDEWKFWLDEASGIAYIRLSGFDQNGAKDIEAALRAMQATGKLKGLVLDLRNNGGGLLSTAIDICAMFLPRGKVVTVRPRVGEEKKYSSNRPGPFATLPLAVLINGNSASASEVVSACLQDHERAVILGERSYGKGSVQHLELLKGIGGQLKFTVARYFPPSDKNIDKPSSGGKDEDEWGVKPDKNYEVKLTAEQQKDLEDFLRESEIIRPAGKTNPKKIDDIQLKKAVEAVKAKVAAGK